jgi:hypothetical protein
MIDEKKSKRVAFSLFMNEMKFFKNLFYNATSVEKASSWFKRKFEIAVIMKAIKKKLLKNLKLPFVKIDPHFMLLILVIVFFVLLIAAENVIKHTLIPQ